MKKKLIALVLALCLVLVLIGCKIDGTTSSIRIGSKGYESHTSLRQIEEQEHLYYDKKTKVVYIIFCEKTYQVGYGYMSPYYAPNGLPYLYDVENGELVEIEK